MTQIDILLSTHNGAHYVGAQIESLFRQTFHDWRLLIRDDISTDHTFATLQLILEEHSDKMVLLENFGKRYGIMGSYSTLMQASEAPYVMLCDQDDIWYPEKIERSLAMMKEMEERFGADVPLLVHSDAQVVDADLKPRHPSFHNMQQLAPWDVSLSRLLVQNVVHGCTAMMNRKLLEFAAPIPKAARMHDAWIGLVAAAVGHIGFIDAPLLDYRQHDGNAIGAKRRKASGLRSQVIDVMEKNMKQAEALSERISPVVSLETRELLLEFTNLPQTPPMRRRMRMMSRGFLRKPWYHNLPLLAYS